jgi:hypothetical protein
MFVAAIGHTRVVELLIDAGASVDAKDNYR